MGLHFPAPPRHVLLAFAVFKKDPSDKRSLILSLMTWLKDRSQMCIRAEPVLQNFTLLFDDDDVVGRNTHTLTIDYFLHSRLNSHPNDVCGGRKSTRNEEKV